MVAARVLLECAGISRLPQSLRAVRRCVSRWRAREMKRAGNRRPPTYHLPVLRRSALRCFPRFQRILHPGHGHQEQRREKEAKQRVHPDQRRIEGAESKAGDEDSEGTAPAGFHGL